LSNSVMSTATRIHFNIVGPLRRDKPVGCVILRF
jgi:hypothetical protein